MTRKLPNWLTAYTHFLRHDEAPEAYHLWTALTMLSAAVNRNVWCDRGYYRTWPTLYTLLVGPNGLGKETATRIGLDLLKETGLKIGVYKDNALPSQIVKFMHEAVVRMGVGGKQVVKTPVLFYASDLTTKWGQVTQKLTALLNDLWNLQGDYEDGPLTITAPSLTFLGCCERSWIKEELDKDSRRSAFMGRMAVVPAYKKRQLSPTITLTAEDYQLRADLVKDLTTIGHLYGEMRFTPEADKFWQKWYCKLPTDFTILPHGQDSVEVRGFLCRKGQTVHRLSMLHSLARTNSLDIDKDDIQWAIGLAGKMEQDARDIKSGKPFETKRELLKRTLITISQKHNPMPLRLIKTRNSYYITVDEIERCLKEFEAEGFLTWIGNMVEVKT